MAYQLPNEALADNVIKVGKLDATLANAFVPVGGIIMWNGSIAEAEALSNWAICDGANGTPDLRDKFVMGVGSSVNTSTAAKGEQAGNNTIQLTEAQMPSHNHDITDPGHNHSITDNGHTHQGRGLSLNQVFGGVGITLGSGQGYTVGYRNANDNFNNANTTNTTGITINNNSAGITSQAKGSNSNIDNRPSYFALCYIMRVS
tara:strand:- start:2403 stop:3011 length:609 start_codon:yes stop_codon:yes gene_type:complete